MARFQRDTGDTVQALEGLSAEQCLAVPEIRLDGNGKVVLEEYCLSVTGTPDVPPLLAALVNDAVWADLGRRFAVVSDELFSYFAGNACETATHIRIDDATGTVVGGALFNQENVPSETLFYALLKAQPEKGKDRPGRRSAAAALQALAEKLHAAGDVLQVGADETTGLGWCSVSLQEVK